MTRTILITGLLIALLPGVATYAQSSATPESAIQAADGFRVDLLYSVPKEKYGSWVNMCVDPRGRLIVSDQYGLLYRVTPPGLGSDAPPVIESIPVDLGEAQGLLWAFDSLYVVVNRGQKFEGGVYRVRDTNADDQLDSVEQLRALSGRGEHGPHAVLVAPDGESLYVVCGDGTPLTTFDTSRVPRVWDEDLLLPRTYGRGFMKGVRAPGGYVARIDPAGTKWELVSVGFRNQYDAALNKEGELFTFDADMEWDMNTPWYRPTRICHVVSGSEFGWRNGAGKWPAYYPDSLPAAVDIGPGSPTGICFGYGANFPAKFRNALFVSDWSYGKLYAVQLEPDGASYGGSFEEFLSGTPLPLTDVVINPQDGAMYFTIGGRKVQSGLYRVTYDGDRPTIGDNSVADTAAAKLRAERRRLEELHVGDDASAVSVAWPYLGHRDRFLRYAARIAIEHRPLVEWQERALTEADPLSAMTALLALARQHERADRGEGQEIDTLPPDWRSGEHPGLTPERAALRDRLISALDRLDWKGLTTSERLLKLRVYTLTFLRLGPPTEQARSQLIDRLDAIFPVGDRELDSELGQMLVYLQSPTAAAKAVSLLAKAPTQEEQIDIAKTLRHLRVGWTPKLREEYFSWFGKARHYRGGASFSLFVQHIQEDAVSLLSEPEKERWVEFLAAAEETPEETAQRPARPLVKEWQLRELEPLVKTELIGRDFNRGREMFAAANCFGCHRFDNQGGAIGPDLTALSGRFGARDLLESIVDPDKVISDQYGAVTVITNDGKVVTGRIVNLNGDTFNINTDMLNPDKQERIDRNQIEQMFPAKTSMMPRGLLNSLNEDEVLDLVAYLFSGGNRHHTMFKTN